MWLAPEERRPGVFPLALRVGGRPTPARRMGEPDQENILMFVIGGDGPRAEFTDESMKELELAGVWPPKPA